MAISCTTDRIVLTDDTDPSRPAAVIHLPATPEEIDAAILAYYGPPPQTPDWGHFKRTCLADHAVNQVLVAAQSTAPAAALALPAALISLAQGGEMADFRGAWLLMRNLGLVPQATLDHLAALAADCHLPAEFVQLFEPDATPQFNADGTPYAG